jgi:predicted membrane channel-forming protein YqfA (hemolysin III family)
MNGAAAVALIGRAGPWGGWRPATCLPDDCFCEALRTGLIAQPANTWSSLAFVIAAFWVAHRLSRRRSPPALDASEGLLFAGSLLVVGLGSAFYHASLTFAGQVLDVSGMYLIATFVLFHRLSPKASVPPVLAVLGFVLANGVLMTAQVTTPSLRRVVFGLLLLAALGVEWRGSRAGRKWLSGGVGLMTLAFVLWVVDRQRLACEPSSLIQGHAVWHLFGALASACLYLSYETEAAARTAP